jgi:hypothetical protein
MNPSSLAVYRCWERGAKQNRIMGMRGMWLGDVFLKSKLCTVVFAVLAVVWLCWGKGRKKRRKTQRTGKRRKKGREIAKPNTPKQKHKREIEGWNSQSRVWFGLFV